MFELNIQEVIFCKLVVKKLLQITFLDGSLHPGDLDNVIKVLRDPAVLKHRYRLRVAVHHIDVCCHHQSLNASLILRGCHP